MFNNISFFAWIGFFFGGAIGSLIILGVQALFIAIRAKRKYKDEKARRNAEACRAVIAQILAYAAYLWGLEPSALEQCGYWGVAYAPPGPGAPPEPGFPWLARRFGQAGRC